MPKVGNKKFAYTDEGMDAAEDYAMETGEDIIPTYDAGGRVENIQGYGDGGKVTYIESEPGKFEEQHHFSKQQELSRERDIKNQAKGIVSEKYKHLDVADITKSVEAKEREAIRSHKKGKILDEMYESRKADKRVRAKAKEKAKASAKKAAEVLKSKIANAKKKKK